jgi:hypothetical protein
MAPPPNQPPKPPFRAPMRSMPMRPQMTSQQEFESMQARVGAMYGAFGGKQSGPSAAEQNPLIDNHLKPTLRLFAIVGAISAAVTLTLGAQNILVNIVAGLAFAVFLYNTIARKPVYLAARTMLALAIFIEAPQETPTWWTSPLKLADTALYASLKDFMGVPGMSLPFFFFACLGLIWRGRKAVKKEIVPKPPRVAVRIFAAFLIALTALEVWGIARGGAIQPSFFQILQLLTLPICGFAFLYSFRGPEDLGAIGSIIVAAAVVRSAFVAIMYVVSAAAFRHEEGFFVTTHSDSMLFVAGITFILAFLLEHRKSKTILKGTGLILAILVGVALNNRRLAFVSLGFLPVMVFLSLKPSPIKRRLTRALIILGVLGTVYFAIGSQVKDVAIFAPARQAMSVLNQDDNSSESRDIENYNLILTLKDSPVVGHGFGWEYIEKLKVYDISDLFSLYLYIPHNGVLWLWSVGGVVGFAALWFIYPVAAMLAIRVMRRGRTPMERAAGLGCLGVCIATVTQCWGDQGFHSYMTLVLFSLALGVAARLNALADTA